MSDPSRAALKQALAALDQARTAVLAAMVGGDAEPSLGTKEAADVWRVTESAALKRLKRIGSKGLDGRWSAPASVVRAGRSPVQAR